MSRRKHVLSKMIQAADLDADLEPGLPILELAGDKRILIEKHLSVVAYSGEAICVKMRYGLVYISGCNLLIEKMSGEQLVVQGNIDCIRIEKGG